MTKGENLRSNIHHVALIFEGGGMRASYTAGFVTMLLEQQLYFDYVAGISAGSSHAINYVSRDMLRARLSFTDLAEDPSFGDIRTWLRGQGFFNAEYLYSESSLADGVIPLDFDTFLRNNAECVIGAFLKNEGGMVYWHKHDYVTIDDLTIRARASSTVPYLMPDTVIDGKTYVDGGVGEAIPLGIAEKDGYDRFVIVLTRPRGFRQEPPVRLALIDHFLSQHPVQKEALMTRYLRYNDTLRKIDRLEREGKAYVFYPEYEGVRMTEKGRDKLMEQYVLGHEQAYKELPLLRRFLDNVKKEKSMTFLKSGDSKTLLDATSERFKKIVSGLTGTGFTEYGDEPASTFGMSDTDQEKGKETP
ncbi:MAG: patatin family protein [Clostridiaceae bacterium]|jgi:predicted patatin/cPLA2 family phospholipase|nr:patatin family protein [Clostridiaceae bacterium]